MVLKDESLDLNAKLKILGFFKVSGSSETKRGRKYGLASSTLSTVLKKKKNVLSSFKRWEISDTKTS
jgi:lambda repressor-like predicted transcriptional regulator